MLSQGAFWGGLGTLGWGWHCSAVGLALAGSPLASGGVGAPLPVLASPWPAAAWQDELSPVGACLAHGHPALPQQLPLACHQHQGLQILLGSFRAFGIF